MEPEIFEKYINLKKKTIFEYFSVDRTEDIEKLIKKRF